MKNFGKTTDIRDIITVGYEADNAVLYSTSQSLTNDQKIQARANIGAGTSSFDGDYKSLANKPTIPTKTSQLENNSNFATTSQVEAKYAKPKGGIPKTDLATAVQNSLTAADSAVRYTTSQSLTDAQKEQARKNIGAGTSSFSGNYKDLAGKPDIPPEVSIVQSTGESTSSVMSQNATTDAVNSRLSKTDNTNIEVLGAKKATTTLGGNQLYAPNGIIFGGTAAAAGLVTRGICGITTPSAGGACSKENLYINYDGNNDFNAGRQVVLNAGTVGNHLGSNMYQYTAPRGEIVKNWVEAKGYATSVKVNGNTIASSGGVVDIGNVIKSIKTLNTNNTTAQATNASEAIVGSGTINLHKVAKTGSYNDLSNIPVINQDLAASGFTPVTNTYYKHTGTTTDLYTNGVIYFYNGTKYASLDGSTAVTEQVTVAVDDWVLDCITYKQVPVNPIESGDNFGVLYFDTTKTPDFSAINVALSKGETLWGRIIYNAGSSSNPYNPELSIVVRGFPAGKTMNGTTFTSNQWGIEYCKRSPDEEVDTYFYATDELSTALGFAASGWQTERFIDMDTLYVKHTEKYFSTAAGGGFFNWDEYISKDGKWEQVPVGSSTIHPFTYRASKTLGTEMNANSVVSLGYNDTASMRECASAGVAIGEVPTDSGNGIIFYSVTKPTQAVNLVVEISETTTNA